MIITRGGSQIPQEVGEAVGRESFAVYNSHARVIFVHGMITRPRGLKRRLTQPAAFQAVPLRQRQANSAEASAVARACNRYVPVTRTKR